MNMRSAERHGLATRSGNLAAPPAREAWIDVARAVALILVVLGHVERGLVAAGIMPVATAGDFDRVIYSFHIPLFFLISGFLFARSIRERPFLSSWRFRTLRLAKPYIVWSIVLLGLIVFAADLANAPVSAGDALSGILLLPIQPVSIFWFLYTLLLCTCVSGLATEYGRFTPARLLYWSFVLHLIYLISLSDFQAGPGLQFVRFAEHQLYFAIGFFLAASGRLKLFDLSGDQIRQETIAVFTILMASCFLAAAIVLTRFDLSYHSVTGTVAALTANAAILSACYLAFGLRSWTAPAPLLTISAQTLAIFCMHVPFVAVTRIALIRFGVEDTAVQLVLGTAAGLAGPLFALKLIQGLGLAGLAGFGSERQMQSYGGRP